MPGTIAARLRRLCNEIGATKVVLGLHLGPNLVPKFHYLWHIGAQSEFINPRICWTYSNEDWVGRLAVIGESCRYKLPAALLVMSIGSMPSGEDEVIFTFCI